MRAIRAKAKFYEHFQIGWDYSIPLYRAKSTLHKKTLNTGTKKKNGKSCYQNDVSKISLEERYLSEKEEYLLVPLCRLRLGVVNRQIGDMFGVSENTLTQERSVMQQSFSSRRPHPHVHRRPHGVTLRFLQSTRRSLHISGKKVTS